MKDISKFDKTQKINPETEFSLSKKIRENSFPGRDLENPANFAGIKNAFEMDNDFIESILRVVPIDDEYYIIHGNNMVSRSKFEYIDEAWTYIKSKPWEIILYFCSLWIEHTVNNLKKQSNEQG